MRDEGGVSNKPDKVPFDGGPFSAALRALRIPAPSSWQAIVAALLVGGVPPVVLATFQGNATGPAPREAILCDIAFFTRFVIATPVLLVAEPFCLPALAGIVRRFRESGLIRETDRARYDYLVDSTSRLLSARTAAIVILGLAYAHVFWMHESLLPMTGVTWRTRIVDGSLNLTPAGWWLALVSMPLFLSVIYAWLWCLLLWARLLQGLGRLDLRLMPTHPDLVGGIGFVSRSTRVLSLVAFAVACVPAGMVGNLILFEGRNVREFQLPVATLLLILLILITGPLALLYPALRRAKRLGAREYSVLAWSLGQRLHERWIGEHGGRADPSALEANDFSAATDLFQVVERVQKMRIVPISVTDVYRVGAATLLPFVPVLLTQFPAKQVLTTLAKLVF